VLFGSWWLAVVLLVFVLVLTWAFAERGCRVLFRLGCGLPIFCALWIVFLHEQNRFYQRSQRRVREVQALSLRDAAEEFRQLFGNPPGKLDDLVSAGLLRTLPTDPLTRTANWRVIIRNGLHGPNEIEIQPPEENKEPPRSMDSTTKAAVVFAVLGVICLVGARVSARLQARLATSFLVLGLNLVGGVSLFSALLIAIVIWKGLART
jgi:Ca2+/Na+ antiporter